MSAIALARMKRRVRSRRRRRPPDWWKALAYFGLGGCVGLVADITFGWMVGVLPILPGVLGLAATTVLGFGDLELLRDPPVVRLDLFLLGGVLLVAATGCFLLEVTL